MKYINHSKLVLLFVVAVMIFAGCKKLKEVDAVGDGGQTLIKMLNGGTVASPGEKAVAIDFVSTPTTIIIADVRRDPANPTDLNQPVTVSVKDDTAAVRLAGYLNLNPAWYTISGSGVTKTGGVGGTYTVTFAPGEFSKPITITITDATVLDPSEIYGLGFTVLTSTFGNVSVASKSFVGTIGAKNKYDGRYELRGNHNRVPSATVSYAYPYITEYHLVTVGASTVRGYWPDAGGFGHPIGVGPDPVNDLSWYGGGISPTFTFDPVTNLATNIYNYVPPTPIVMFNDPLGVKISRYDETTKKVYLYFYYYTGAGQDFSNRGWNDTLTYLGPR